MSLSKRLTALFVGVLLACTLVVTSSTRTQADSVVSSITVGKWPLGVTINPAGTFAYVTNVSSNTVSKINLATDTVAATITVGTNPRGVTINPAGTFAYVANHGSNTVSKINLANDTVAATITGFEYGPWGVAINPAGTFAFVTNQNRATVSKINMSTDTIVATITVGDGPTSVAINSAGTFAYVSSMTDGNISKINLTTNAVTTIAAGQQTYGVVINPAGTFAYVASRAPTQRVVKISLATDTVVATIPVKDNFLHNMAINPAGTFLYLGTGNSGSYYLQRINLASDQVVEEITTGYSPLGVAVNSDGTFAYVTNHLTDDVPGTVQKIALTVTDPQTITFAAVSTQLLGAKTVALTATASSTLTVAFTSATPTVCTVSGSTVTMVTVGDCTINANQAGGSGWDAATQVSRTFTILPSPPVGEVGVSIQNGDSYVNTKQVTLNLIWPEYATAARISNDGGFAASKTQTKDLAASIDWELDDSVKGIYTKVVYVRFNGVADTTKTYSDDIILDTTAPTIESSSASAASSSVDVSLKATDDITGMNKVEIRNDSKTVLKDYATKISVPLADLSLSVSSNGVRKSAATSVEIRVSDNAGNWTGWQIVTVAGLNAPTVTTPTVTTPTVTTPTVTTPTVTTPTVTTPKLTTSKSASAKSIATFAKLKVLATSKVSLKVVASSAKFCRVSGSSLKGLKAGSCKVAVTVKPKKGKAISKTVTLKVSK